MSRAGLLYRRAAAEPDAPTTDPMRLCPSQDGSGSPLITHRIGADVCLSRQSSNFHKCHRCIYRGQSAEWQPEPEVAFRVTQGVDPDPDDVKRVEIPRPAVREPQTQPHQAAANG